MQPAAFFTAPHAGTYTFLIAADDNAELWGARAGGAWEQLSSVPSYTSFREWWKHESGEQSAAVQVGRS